MKYLGWVLFLVFLISGGVFFYQKHLPLRNNNTELRKENRMWQKEVEALKGGVSIKSYEPSDTVKSKPITFLQDDLFESYENFNLTPKGKESLRVLASELKRKKGEIWVMGHTDNVKIGPSLRSIYPTNLELSTIRAAAVVRFLISCGIDHKRLAAMGYGPSRPVASNDTKEGRKRNRRIEILMRESP